jgi:hypothetical protein
VHQSCVRSASIDGFDSGDSVGSDAGERIVNLQGRCRRIANTVNPGVNFFAAGKSVTMTNLVIEELQS